MVKNNQMPILSENQVL